jgi:hypothetical protein
MNKRILFFGDIDGCVVEGFDGKGLNEAAYAERVKLQPINVGVREYLKNWSNKSKDNIAMYFITGRKKSLHELTTRVQLCDMVAYIQDIFYYPEHLGYEPFQTYVDWKVHKLNFLIGLIQPELVIVLEDSIEVLNAIHQSQRNIPFNYWFVIKNSFIIRAKTIDDVKNGNLSKKDSNILKE